MEIDLDFIECQSVDIDVEEVDTASLNTVSLEKKRKRKLRSFVWRYFKFLPLGEDNKRRAKCTRCGTEYIANSKYGTENMKRHLDTCLKAQYYDVGQLLLGQQGGMVTLAAACVLDPRYKLQFVDFSYKKIYGPDFIESIRLKNKLFSLFDEYMATKSPDNVVPTTQSMNPGDVHSKGNEGSDAMTDSIFKEFDKMSTSEFRATIHKSELQLYLDKPKMNRNVKIDVLHFWQSNQFRYPVLATMACDVLTVYVSSVASEACFSVGGRVLDAFHSSLKPNTVEVLVCIRDWLYDQNEDNKEDTEDLTQDIFKWSLNDDEQPSQGSTSALVDEQASPSTPHTPIVNMKKAK